MDILSDEDELVLEKNLVWIFADRRSGTTWLAKELLSHQTQCMDEPLIGLHLGRIRQTDNMIVRTLDLGKARNDYFFSESYYDTWVYFLRKLILNRIHNQFQNLSKKIIVKEPSGSMGADILAKCLPNSKIIILLRDPRDIIDSKLDESAPDGWETKEKAGTRPPIMKKNRTLFIKKFANFWLYQIELLMRIYQEHSENLRYLLRYENLRKNTEDELKKVYQFLEIGIDNDALHQIVNKFAFENIPTEKKGKQEFRRFASPGKWKDNFDDEEKKILNEILKEKLNKFGY